MYSVITGYANMPVVDVTFWDAVRFANWMDNGEGSASTETGAYTLLGDTPTPSNALTVTRNAGATVWIPSEDEWYKAAYYDPTLNSGSGGYWLYPTRSNTAPGNVVGSGSNEANYNDGYYTEAGPNYLTAVGSFTNSASYYGTYDQAGDVWNWNDTLYDSNGDRVLRGGSWYYGADFLWSPGIYDQNPSIQDYDSVGFRIASDVPEPTSIMLMLAGVAGLALMRRKTRKV